MSKPGYTDAQAGFFKKDAKIKSTTEIEVMTLDDYPFVWLVLEKIDGSSIESTCSINTTREGAEKVMDIFNEAATNKGRSLRVTCRRIHTF